MLIVRRSKLYYTVSGIITLIGVMVPISVMIPITLIGVMIRISVMIPEAV